MLSLRLQFEAAEVRCGSEAERQSHDRQACKDMIERSSGLVAHLLLYG